jgi:hypothetical protein
MAGCPSAPTRSKVKSSDRTHFLGQSDSREKKNWCRESRALTSTQHLRRQDLGPMLGFLEYFRRKKIGVFDSKQSKIMQNFTHLVFEKNAIFSPKIAENT